MIPAGAAWQRPWEVTSRVGAGGRAAVFGNVKESPRLCCEARLGAQVTVIGCSMPERQPGTWEDPPSQVALATLTPA